LEGQQPAREQDHDTLFDQEARGIHLLQQAVERGWFYWNRNFIFPFQLRDMATKIQAMKDSNPNKKVFIRRLLGKLYDIGLIPTADTLERVNQVTASCFCRRRLPSMMMSIGMMSNVSPIH
jgi:hypothetical protein